MLVADKSREFVPCPEGMHLGILISVIDLGTHMEQFPGSPKPQARHKVKLTWEIPGELMENGKPFIVSKDYLLSLNAKATLRKHLESWRNKPLTEAEAKAGITLDTLLGRPAQINVMHVPTSTGGTYAKITGVFKPPQGLDIPKMENEPLYFALDNFDDNVFAKLPQRIRDSISETPEYKLATGFGHTHSTAAGDEIPF
jgi:hypothetical protein